MDRNGRVLDGSNRNSDDETQSVRKVRSRPLSWSPETDVEGINIKNITVEQVFQLGQR